MLMSKSRLENFLYALYSLDSSDLPTPLSRIEELYKCWVTGEEAPTFEPLSRVEKYLMAILGAYNVDELPNPLSRVEVLLHKLATGGDNLDDVESFLSEHEELLAEIIRNGGAGVNIEYVLYTLSTGYNTLYNTAEKPVKSAILKGNTERIFVPNKNLFDGELEQGGINNTSTGENVILATTIRSKNYVKIGTNTTFTISREKGSKPLGFRCYDEEKNFLGTIFDAIGHGVLKKTYITDSNTTYIRFVDNTNDLNNKYQIELGTTATEYEQPNYELQSVQMPVLTTSNEDGTKSNILTVNEDVELRGIGDVKDKLDLMTGELTQHVGEVVLDGSQDGLYDYATDVSLDLLTIRLPKIPNMMSTDSNIYGLLSDKYVSVTKRTPGNIYSYNGRIMLVKSLSELESFNTPDKIKLFLSQNPITMQYPLATPIIKTVDLSVVDQDGNNTKLSTFDDITRVTLSSEGLIPAVELEVATKNEEDLEDSIVYTTHTLSEEFNTLYNTAEKPVKSAILKGQTLVNVHPTDYVVSGSNPTFFLSKIIPKTMIKPNTRYFLRLYNTHQSVVSAYFKPCVKNRVDFISSDNKCAVFTTKPEFADSDFGNNKIHFYSSSALTLEDVKDTKVILCEYVDGMENWDIPYFEGMQSVKMPVLTTTGSNMVNPTDIEVIGCNSYDVDSDGIVNVVGDNTDYWAGSYIRYTHHLKGNTTYYIYCNGDSTGTVKVEGWVDNINSGKISWNNFYKYTPKTDVLYEAKIFPNKDASPFTCSKIRIGIFESTTEPSSFEPFKSNILTVNEEVTLRSNGDVYDELNLLTGRLTQRIDENNEVLSQEVVKTVDLSVVDQDGNDTELSTFNDITHVTLSSEGLIPEAELEVAEKVPEVVASMLTISREQEVINATANEQSENVDATMIATTEIYEELL